jgi:hypothetical protein
MGNILLALHEQSRLQPVIEQTLAVPSGAANWTRLEDRMRFIIYFFRSHQKDKRLFTPPFPGNQVAAIKAGHFPGGKL